MKRSLCHLMILGGLAAVAVPASAQVGKSLYNGDDNLRKIDSAILQAEADEKKGKSTRGAFESRARWAMRGEKLQLRIAVTEMSTAVERQIKATGAEIVHSYGRGEAKLYTVQVARPSQARALAAIPEVRLVYTESAGLTSAQVDKVGATSGQAERSVDADRVQSELGINGDGVRVGVISNTFFKSNSFQPNDRVGAGTLPTVFPGVATGTVDQVSGDLPAEIRILDPGPESAEEFGDFVNEGNAMAQLVYDIAPGTEISFASAFTGFTQFADNIRALAEDPGFECDIIVDDSIQFAESVYQDSFIAQAVKDVVADGVQYYASAGNFANYAHEHPFTDSSASDELGSAGAPTGVDFHDWGTPTGQGAFTHMGITLAPGEEITIVLHWDEPSGGGAAPGPGAEADLDLYLVSDLNLPINSNIVASSVTAQGSVGAPLGDPFEFVQFANPEPVDTVYYAIINHADGREPSNMHVSFLTNLGFPNLKTGAATLGSRTIVGHRTVPTAGIVGAILYCEIKNGTAVDFDGAGSDYTLATIDSEPFSALGGDLPIFFADDGSRLAETEIRTKPDFVGPDQVNTTFFIPGIDFPASSGIEQFCDGADDDDPNFLGTSASAPVVAGIAALMLEKNSALQPAEALSILAASTSEVDEPGFDFVSGAGVVNAFDAVSAVSSATFDDAWMIR